MSSSTMSMHSLLPLEMYSHIAALADNASLAALAPVCHFLWSTACAELWREVDDASVMLDLLDRATPMRPRKSHHGGSKCYTVTPFEDLDEREQLLQFKRWKAYAQFTHKVTLNSATLTREKRIFLLKRATKKPLVPHLQTLLLTSEPAYDGDPGYGYVRVNTPHAEHLTMLLISSELHTLAISFFHLENIHFQTLVQRLPKLTDLRIGRPIWDWDNPSPMFSSASLDYMPGFPLQTERMLGYVADPNRRHFSFWAGLVLFDPLASMAPALSTLPNLSELTIDGVSLERASLGNLHHLRSLTSLTIVEPLLETNWGGATSPSENAFPKLRDLVLRRTRPEVARELFKCGFLLKNIHCLRWDGDPFDSDIENGVDGEAYRGSLQLLTSNTKQLHSLHLRCDYSPTPTSFWHESTALEPITAMEHLFELSVSSFTHEPECGHDLRSVIAHTPSFLRSLHIENVAVPVHTLPQLALAYPFLSHLRVELDARDWQSFSNPIDTHAAASEPISLLLRFERTGWPKLGAAEEARVKWKLVSYLKAVWPTVSLHLNPVERMCDWQVELIGDLQHILGLVASAEGSVP